MPTDNNRESFLRHVADFHQLGPTAGELAVWLQRLDSQLLTLQATMDAPVADGVDPLILPRYEDSLSAAPVQPGNIQDQQHAPVGAGATDDAVVHALGPAASDTQHPGTPLHHLPATQLSALVRNGHIAPTDIARHYLDRIAAQPELNAFITVLKDAVITAARDQEAQLARGEDPGPLAGVPIAIKDLMQVRHVVMTAGARVLPPEAAGEDAVCVARLRAAGALIIGTTTLHELAYGVTTENPHFGRTPNPRHPAHMAGGSSGGSAAAVAARVSVAALGTDTGGSIRIPAACCGIVGLKPTYGRVSRAGVLPLAWSLDHVGPLTQTVGDAALLLDVLADRDPAGRKAAAPANGFVAALDGDIRGLRVGRPAEHFFSYLDPQVQASMDAAYRQLEHLGARVQTVSMPSLSLIGPVQFITLAAEAAAAHWGKIRSSRADLGDDIRERLDVGIIISAAVYLHTQRLRVQLVSEMQSLFHQVDALVVPTLPMPAPPAGAATVTIGDRQRPTGPTLTRLTSPFNVTGLPAITVPCGVSSGGLPLGLQVAGPHWRDDLVLRIAHAYEQSLQG